MRKVAPPELAPGAVEVECVSPPAARQISGRVRESVTTLAAQEHDDLHSLLSRIPETLPAGETPLAVFLFGRSGALREASEHLYAATEETDWPLLAVEGCPCHDGPLAGVQIYSAPCSAVRRVRSDGEVIGSVFDDGEATHCVLAGVEPLHTGHPPQSQAHEVFERVEAGLESVGFSLSDLVRTWFYNRRILDWYREFNRVRAAIYARVDFRSGAVPASTGIEGSHGSASALALAAWAMRSIAAAARATPVASPLQCPASQYGSSFSRAMEIVSAGRRRIFVSGTASIGAGGETLWPGDAKRQVSQTMAVIEAILASRGMTLASADRAIAYFKRGVEPAVFEAWLQARGLEGLPCLQVRSDVCRDDLLFELEIDAVHAPGA